ncbi:MAG: hypothetical protein U0835_02780 [Isosphaeraceae bacterium]
MTEAHCDADPLLAYRDRFPILASTNYLISNSLGAVPASAEDALREYYRVWATRGVRWEEVWWTLSADMGDRVAPLISGAGEVVFQPSVTLAHAVLFSAFDFRARAAEVVTDAMHFPSILYLIDGLKARGPRSWSCPATAASPSTPAGSSRRSTNARRS